MAKSNNASSVMITGNEEVDAKEGIECSYICHRQQAYLDLDVGLNDGVVAHGRQRMEKIVMNILFLTGNLGIGGTELYALDYAKSMRQNGHKVFWASIKDGPMRSIAMEEGIDLLHCAFEKRTPALFLRAASQLRKICQEKNIHIIHAIDAYTALVSVTAFKGKRQKPKLMWSSVGIGSKSYSLMRKMCESGLDCIIAPSHFIRNRMIEEGFIPEKINVYSQSRPMKKCTSERNALRAQFGLNETDCVIGTMGRVVHMKGNRTVVKAMHTVINQCRNAKLLIVGDGPERKDLEELAQQLGIQDNIIFAGFRTDIENMYTVFDIVAFPTYYEALGYIPYEAMYYERPLIASLTGGIPEIVIDGYNGMLVPPAMEQEWANAILCLLQDKNLYDKLKQNGKKYYDANLAYDSTHRKLETIYEKVMNQ